MLKITKAIKHVGKGESWKRGFTYLLLMEINEASSLIAFSRSPKPL
jgi:hypothetical protein